MTPGAAFIDPARPEDASEVHALMAQAFGESYLRFTAYQAPRAVALLAEQITGALLQERPSFFLLRRGGTLEGFYNAVERQGEFFLNYIATRPAKRGHGEGRLLLDHFEATGMARDATSLGLDVFRSNAAAEAWYRRRGYAVQGSRFLARFGLAAFPGAAGPVLELDPVELGHALEEESRRGASRIDCGCSGVPVRLGLIDGAVCNLMEPRGAPALAVAPAVARRFGASRRWLLASGPEGFTGQPSPESQEEALYMKKVLPRIGEEIG